MSFNLLALLDDIASMMDDVSIMTKIALKKTSGLVTDDLAVNIGQVHGVTAKQEFPTVFKIFLGAIANKIIIIPFVLLLTYYSPLTLKYILLLGGLYLSYEGAHKIFDRMRKKKKAEKTEESQKLVSVKDKIFGAIKTDFVLSIEIIVIAQSAITGSIQKQAMVLFFIGLIVCLLIYGLVALLIKIDDIGLYLVKKNYRKAGLFLVELMPKLMKVLSVIGVVAMLLVGGDIISHHFHLVLPGFKMLNSIFIGFTAGLAVMLLFSLKNFKKLMKS